ncbi:MAG: GTPase HflX [Pseudomonadota bacterium]
MTTGAVVIHPNILTGSRNEPASARDPLARLDEAVGLTRAINLKVLHAEAVKITRPKPATLMGGGLIERLAGVIHEVSAELMIVDAAITPVQQRNLERELGCKVIDRTGLILEIFGARARTKEGRLQVELAALTYQRSRLVRSWTHLERQRGGFGFLGGPGESQLEIDRRLITERISRLKSDLEQVRKTRSLHRSARQKVPYPVIALVGYTNAGKSTLFNRLTNASVRSEDLLFATLDPTMRKLELPDGAPAILSDTVGFISDLPTELVAAFRATLEEVTAASLVVHVRDISHPDGQAQAEDVYRVLANLEIGEEKGPPILEAWNKSDLLNPEAMASVRSQAARRSDTFVCSAVTGAGCEALVQGIQDRLSEGYQSAHLSLPLTDGAGISWLYDHGSVLDRRDDDRLAHMKVRLDRANLERFLSLHRQARFRPLEYDNQVS